jgi:hypothetical protein
MTTGAKIGIALGAASGAILLAVLFWLLLRYMRHRDKSEEDGKEEPIMPQMATVRPRSDVTQIDPDLQSPAWSGHKSELPADESTQISPVPTYQASNRPYSAEVEGSPVPQSPRRPLHDGSLQVPGLDARYYEMAG